MMKEEILSASLKLSSSTSPLISTKIMECLLNSKLSLLSSDPLFSCIVTFYTLILIYLPHHFSKIFFSPVLILTASLLFSILRLGATQKSHIGNKENLGEPEGKLEDNAENEASIEKRKSNSAEETQPSLLEEEVQLWITQHSETDIRFQKGFDPNPCFADSFVEWNVKAPLEVIYEEYEGDEAECESNGKEEKTRFGIERYPSLSLYYPETDSDSSSECGFPADGKWESPDNDCFIWEEEDREGLIEIALNGAANDKKSNMVGFHVEEDNLIEIDISPKRYDEITGENSSFSGEIDSVIRWDASEALRN